MPTVLPTPVRPLPWPAAAHLVFLAARIRWLDMRAHALVRHGSGFSDDRLLRLMRKWLACHEAIGALLPGIPEPEHVREVRAILQGPSIQIGAPETPLPLACQHRSLEATCANSLTD